jgi:hypothetical protein
MVRVDVPSDVFGWVLIVMVTDPDVALDDKLTLVGLNEALAFAGRLATLNDPTVPVNPFVPLTVMVVLT